MPTASLQTFCWNCQIKRFDRFPDDFLLRLTNQEVASLRSHFAILKTGRGRHRKYPAACLHRARAVIAATILSSPRAAAISVYIVRAFVRLRSILETNAQLARKLDALEKLVAVMDANAKRQFKELRAMVFALASRPDYENRLLLSPTSPNCSTRRHLVRS